MKQCIIADFEWCVTPHRHHSHFRYFNEILSAAVISIDEAGNVLDSMYTLVRPLDVDYLHPVILSSLSLDRDALASAVPFSAFFDAFSDFISASGGTPVYTWGCADRASLLQNLRVKGGLSAEEASRVIPQMRDLQPTLCRCAGIKQPYPSLASLISLFNLNKTDEKSHNALSDAHGTARILAHFMKNSETSAIAAPLFEEEVRREVCPKKAQNTAITKDTHGKRRRYPIWKKRQKREKKAVPK